MNEGATLILFDPHEDVRWVRETLEIEAGGFERVVLGGDYFDALFPPDGGGHVEMCRLLLDLRRQYADRLRILLGNHDVHYLELRAAFQDRAPFKGSKYTCSGFSIFKAKAIHEHLPLDFWRDTRLFTIVHGHLVSHAGVAPKFWKGRDVPTALGTLDASCAKALANLGTKSPILSAGRARKGRCAVGGLTWFDWDDEFQDGLPLPQLVGHSPGTLRRKGRSWCADCGQSIYALLNDDELVFKLKGREVFLAEPQKGCWPEPKNTESRRPEINAAEFSRIRDLPESERDPFRQWLFHSTRPVIDGEPLDAEHQDGYYLCDYERWKSNSPPAD